MCSRRNDRVDVVGVSKGHGFAGVHKRHHFGGGGGAHGSMFPRTRFHRASAFPSRVMKGMRAPATWQRSGDGSESARREVLADDHTILLKVSALDRRVATYWSTKSKAPHK